MTARAIVMGLLLAVGTGSTAGAAADLAPLVVGWEQFFKVEWSAGQRNGRPVVQGRILNDWGMPATNVRLLVDTLDDRGQVTAQRVDWLGSQLAPGVTASFEVPVGRPGAAYRVSVFAFDWVQAGGPDDR